MTVHFLRSAPTCTGEGHELSYRLNDYALFMVRNFLLMLPQFTACVSFQMTFLCSPV